MQSKQTTSKEGELLQNIQPNQHISTYSAKSTK